MFKYSKDRPFYINLIYCILCFLCLLLFTSIASIILSRYINNEYVVSLLSGIILIILLYLMYKKDLDKEFKTFIKNIKESVIRDFKYYGFGLLGMLFFNIIIVVFLKDISANESQVRELLFSHTLYTLLQISIIAPISEELIFRKSLNPVIKNKWIYVVVSGLLFGFAHILTNFIAGEFVISDLLYILPYGCLGSSFALMDYDGKSTFNSIMIHFIHNTITAVLLLIIYSSGAI